MPKIHIIKTPPGFAEEAIRTQWVGLEIKLVPPKEAIKAEAGMDPNSPSAGGYIVRGVDAVDALLAANKQRAARFWSTPIPPEYLRFARDCCEEIPG